MKKYNLGSHEAIELLNEEVAKLYLQFPHKFREGRANVNATGEYISNSKNVFQSYQMREVEDARYCQFFLAPASKNCMDHTIWGIGNSFTYECVVCGDGTNNIKFCSECWSNVNDLQYCRSIQSSSYCFGCVSLKNKKYCILNKQYNKKEYEQLLPKIIEHMNAMPYTDKRGHTYRYGEFFPPEFSPFAYNQTIAQEHFPLTKENVQTQGLRWKDREERKPTINVKAQDLPDTITDTSDSITNEVVGCLHEGQCNEECALGFRIIRQELALYKSIGFPLPRLCPNCRHAARTALRNPLGLWKRECMCTGEASTNNTYKNTTEHFHKKERCPNVFETSYNPERKEIVYCEQCYLAEVD